ncbi:MAG TPA: hypothetical protein VNJ01_11090 [Bacteriovoracaceae bacterium]|nr:hypothetical protein [Bacteriovoracaceae bacterium]
MKKIIIFIFKILPLLTIYQGFSSGGSRLGPYVDTLKVALTQYEVAQIIKLVFDDFSRKNGPVVPPEEFAGFLSETFHNQYSVLAREISGQNSKDLTRDIWGKSYGLVINDDVTLVRVVSTGPDGKAKNKDDIAAEFTIQRPEPVARPALAEASDPEAEEASEPEATRVPASEEVVAETGDFDQEGYDRDGFNQEGYDRDGYDQNGMHRSEKEVHYAASESQE